MDACVSNEKVRTGGWFTRDVEKRTHRFNAQVNQPIAADRMPGGGMGLAHLGGARESWLTPSMIKRRN
jgi:hypothetical protein